MAELSVSQLWRNGPDCLSCEAPTFSDDGSFPIPQQCLAELKKSSTVSHNLLTIRKNPTVGEVISCENFSSVQKLLRVTAYVRRALERFKRRERDPSIINPPRDCGCRETLDSDAQKELVHQNDFESLRRQFGLFLDDAG